MLVQIVQPRRGNSYKSGFSAQDHTFPWPKSFTWYLRPAVRARFLDVLLFLLSPRHEGAATKTMNKYHISIDTRAKKRNKARERVKVC